MCRSDQSGEDSPCDLKTRQPERRSYVRKYDEGRNKHNAVANVKVGDEATSISVSLCTKRYSLVLVQLITVEIEVFFHATNVGIIDVRLVEESSPGQMVLQTSTVSPSVLDNYSSVSKGNIRPQKFCIP